MTEMMNKNDEKRPDGKFVQRSLGMTFGENNGEDSAGTRKIEGLAAVYGEVTVIGSYYKFREQIAPGAFDGADMSDVAFYLNHDISKIPMARCRKSRDKNSLEVWADADGLRMRTVLDTENNQDARALCSAIDRGDVDQMSFCFIVDEEKWSDMDQEIPLRTVTKIRQVVEISAVTYPAYDTTKIGFSRAQQSLESDRAALERAKTEYDDRVKSEVCKIDMMKKKILMMH